MAATFNRNFALLLEEIRACRLCASDMPHNPRPIVQLHPDARLLIASQAPGRRVHLVGTPFDDPSGDRLRHWLGIERDVFYDPTRVAILPTSFCFPGKGAKGDLPPLPACASRWHGKALPWLSQLRLTLLIGAHAQRQHLGERAGCSLTETVRDFEHFLPKVMPLPHPSPRNRHWWAKNPWFERDLLPVLRKLVRRALDPPRIDERPAEATATVEGESDRRGEPSWATA